MLGESIASEAGAGRRLIELGCGAGLVAICAALAGYDVTATDYYAEALDFTRVNVFRNTGLLDRDAAGGLAGPCRPALECFDRVVGADLAVRDAHMGLWSPMPFVATLALHGTATIADPGLHVAPGAAFSGRPTAVGLAFGPRVDIQYVDGAIRQTIALLSLSPWV